MDGLVVDLFAGGGGASRGIEAALGRGPDLAINHDQTALRVHAANHPRTRHVQADLRGLAPRELTAGRPVSLLWASPDCTHFSVARGGRPRSQKIRSLPWVVVRWARDTSPAVIVVENVREFESWGPLGADGRPIRARAGESFERWRAALVRLGYAVEARLLDAALYGAPTRRRRLFIVARRDGRPIAWPEPTHGPGGAPLRTAAECIDWSLACPSIFDRPRPLAPKTLWRIAQGIARFVFEAHEPFIVEVNHGGCDARGASLAAPLGTVTAVRRGRALVVPTIATVGYGERPGQAARVPGIDKPLGTVVAGGVKHAVAAVFLAKHFGGVVGHGVERPAQGNHIADVRCFLEERLPGAGAEQRMGIVRVGGAEYVIADIGMRMLEPHELLRAQFGQFAAGYDMGPAQTKSAKVRLIGNSVCPDVAAALVRSLAGIAPPADSTRLVPECHGTMAHG